MSDRYRIVADGQSAYKEAAGLARTCGSQRLGVIVSDFHHCTGNCGRLAVRDRARDSCLFGLRPNTTCKQNENERECGRESSDLESMFSHRDNAMADM